MAKRKGLIEGNAQFISDLPLAVCYQRLQSCEDENLTFQFSRRHADEIHFTVQLRERGIIRAEGKGTLRRWEGTLTRVDCDVKIREGILRWLLLFGGLFFVTMVALPLLLLLSTAFEAFIWVGISLLFFAILSGLMLVVNYYAPIDDTPENLLHIITSALKA
ncbi:MAG: hypothetical protein AAF846_04250 [Chloroflexota bacterium]